MICLRENGSCLALSPPTSLSSFCVSAGHRLLAYKPFPPTSVLFLQHPAVLILVLTDTQFEIGDCSKHGVYPSFYNWKTAQINHSADFFSLSCSKLSGCILKASNNLLAYFKMEIGYEKNILCKKTHNHLFRLRLC